MAIYAKRTSPLDHPEFTTHKNYVAYMRRISNDLTLTYCNSISARTTISAAAMKKVNLIKMTVKNIEMESKIVAQYPEYAEVAISWMPVKAYYLIFNLTILLEYLISADSSFLTASHLRSLNQLKKLVENEELKFGSDVLGQIKTGAEIAVTRPIPHANLRQDSTFRGLQIFRKIADYAKDELRRKHKSERLNKAQMEEFKRMKFMLSEIFYWYRIKVNYRDIQFISSRVSTSEFKSFYTDYCFMTANFYKAFKHCINQVSLQRTGSTLL